MEISIEKRKSEGPVFKEAVSKQQENLIQNNRMTMLNVSENKEDVIPDLGQEIENSFIEEKSIKKKGKVSPSNGPKHVALEERFSYDRQDDDIGMRDVRRKLRYYYESVQKQDKKVQADNLQRLIKECDAYCKGKFMAFKWGRGRERLKEVKALKRDAESKLQSMSGINSSLGNIEYIHNSPVNEYLTVGQTAVVLGRFLVENPIRIPLTILTLPVWAVNECVRGVQKMMGKAQNRRIRLPWMHRLSYYKTQQQFKKKTIGFSTYRSFKERFIEHNTDFEAMNRADQDYLSALDYEDEEELENEDDSMEEDNEMIP